MGKFEISEQMIDKANSEGGLGIGKSNLGPHKPVTQMTWYEAVMFVNWLNIEAGSTPAYKFEGRDRFDGTGNFQFWTPSDAGYNPNNVYRNSLAKYFLPSFDEWYKAAYYDPQKNVYYDYPTGSDSAPEGIDFVGDPNFEAVFQDSAFYLGDPFNLDEPNDITNVGVLSPYGTAGQGGNVMEWEETDLDLVNGSDSFQAFRSIRGGSFEAITAQALQPIYRTFEDPTSEFYLIGFRVASLAIPEPSTVLLGALASAGMLWLRRR